MHFLMWSVLSWFCWELDDSNGSCKEEMNFEMHMNI